VEVALSLFNEPFDTYTRITLEENKRLLTDFVGPLFRKHSPKTKLTFGENCARNISAVSIEYMMSDPESA